MALVTGYCTARPIREPLAGEPQWAVLKPPPEATSSLRIDAGDAGSIRLFDPKELAGEPDTPHCGFHGDSCWAPESPRAGVQVLTLRFAEAVFARAVEVVENQNPGTVFKVEVVRQEDGEPVTVFEGVDRTRACPGFFAAAFDPLPFLTREVRVHLNTDEVPSNVPFASGHVLIDAVGLYGDRPGAEADGGAPDG
jgi:hypothetical protein